MDARGPFTSTWRSVRLAAALALAVTLGIPGSSQAQIVRDGTVGPAGPLRGPNYTIPYTDGTRAGTNLFHSFSRFNIGTTESATFTGPGDLNNVISRVTGGTPSQIDGTLRSRVGQANVWFLNPAGVRFGPNAQLDVPAAFHVSTADEVRFADGAKFSATNSAASGLSVAPPEAFGFLRPNPAGIAVNGGALQAKAGQTLSVVGGDLQVTGGRIRSAGGQVNLVAMAGPGTVQAATGASTAPARGAVRLANGALANSARVNTSGNGGGQITIRGGQIEVTRSSVLADNTGAQDAKGGIMVAGDTVRVADGSKISSSTFGQGHGGTVTVTARDIELRNVGEISSLSTGQGPAGTVTIHADQLRVSDIAGIVTSATPGSTGAAGEVTVTGRDTAPARDIELRNGGFISSSTFGQGPAGIVTIHADQLRVFGDGELSSSTFGQGHGEEISSSTFGQGHGGTVTIHADQLLVSDAAGITSQANQGSTGAAGAVTVTGRDTAPARDIELRNGGFISSSTFDQGHGGTVSVQGDRVEVGNGSKISSSTFGQGHGGTVTVTARDIELRNVGEISSLSTGQGDAGTVTIHADQLRVSDIAGIVTSAIPGSTGAAGAVTVTGRDTAPARDIELGNGGFIGSSTFGQGGAGTVTIHADQLRVFGDGELSFTGITTAAAQGEGGQIELRVGRLIGVFSGSQITTSVTGIGSTGDAGNIMIGSQILVVDRDSLIKANAREGNGGRIDLIVDNILVWPPLEERIQARSERGISGQVNIYAPDQDIAGTLTTLPIKFLEATARLPTACAARLDASVSSLVSSGLGGLPADPDRLLLPSYLSYTGHRPPDDLGPAPGTADHAVPSGRLSALSAGAGRLSFGCGI